MWSSFVLKTQFNVSESLREPGKVAHSTFASQHTCATLRPHERHENHLSTPLSGFRRRGSATEDLRIEGRSLVRQTAGVMIQPGLVIVVDGKVQSVGGSTVPPGAAVIDLRDATLLPGFIDAHTHLTSA